MLRAPQRPFILITCLLVGFVWLLAGCLGETPAPTLPPAPRTSASAAPASPSALLPATAPVLPPATAALASATAVAPDHPATAEPVRPITTPEPPSPITLPPPSDTPTSTPIPTATRPPHAPTDTPTMIPTTVSVARFKLAARLIAFNRNDQIWTITTDGKTVTQVTKKGRNYGPVWSPDGKTIAFISNRDDPAYQLYRMDPDGGNLHALTGPLLAVAPGGGERPDVYGVDYIFSPDGTRLAYTVQVEAYLRNQLFVLDLGSGQSRPVTVPGATTPRPTAAPTHTPTPVPPSATPLPDTTHTPGPSSTAAPPSPSPTPTPPPPISAAWVGQPAWAPDNHTLAYRDAADPEQDVLYLLDVDTGKQTLISKAFPVNQSPIFSRDGKNLYYTSSEGWSMGGLKSELYRIGRDGKNRVKLSPGFAAEPGWGHLVLAPTGSRLAVDWTARMGGFGDPWNNEITVTDTAGKAPVDLSAAYPRPYYGATSPSWAADGRYLAFRLYNCPTPDCANGSDLIMVADTGAKAVTLAELTKGTAPAWQP